MNAREELEIRGVIDKNGKHINEPCPNHPPDQECALCDGTGLIYKGTIVGREKVAEAILAKLPELGFVKLKDVDINKEEIKWLIKGTAKILKKMGFVKMKDVEIDENEVGLLLYRTWNRFSGYEAQEKWTAKHIQTESKTMCANLAHAIAKTKGMIRVKEVK